MILFTFFLFWFILHFNLIDWGILCCLLLSLIFLLKYSDYLDKKSGYVSMYKEQYEQMMQAKIELVLQFDVQIDNLIDYISEVKVKQFFSKKNHFFEVIVKVLGVMIPPIISVLCTKEVLLEMFSTKQYLQILWIIGLMILCIVIFWRGLLFFKDSISDLINMKYKAMIDDLKQIKPFITYNKKEWEK